MPGGPALSSDGSEPEPEPGPGPRHEGEGNEGEIMIGVVGTHRTDEPAVLAEISYILHPTTGEEGTRPKL